MIDRNRLLVNGKIIIEWINGLNDTSLMKIYNIKLNEPMDELSIFVIKELKKEIIERKLKRIGET